MTLAALRRQSDWLARDLRTFPDVLAPQIEQLALSSSPKSCVAVGSGDSHFAAMAATYGWRLLTGMTLAVQSPQTLLYADTGPDDLLVATSASGTSPATIAAMRSAAAGMKSAITCNTGTPLAAAADGVLELCLPSNEPSPGVRTYHASLVAHLYLALAIGRAHGALTASDFADRFARMIELAERIETTVSSLAQPCQHLARRIAGSAVIGIIGGGPNLGTAHFVAAKLTEAAGQLAFGRDVEEWWHVERFAQPRSSPLVVLAPAGKSHARALEVAAEARDLGHHVVLVADPAVENRGIAEDFLAIPDANSEWLSPLLHGLFAPMLAAELAQTMGRVPFGR